MSLYGPQRSTQGFISALQGYPISPWVVLGRDKLPRQPSKHEPLNQCRINVGPAS